MSLQISQDKQLRAMLRVTGCPETIEHDGRVMKCIGQGFQYTAYGDDAFVYKIPLSVEQVCDKFRATWGAGAEVNREQVSRDREAGLAVVRATGDRITSGELPSRLIADASIDSELRYEQSRVLPLRDVFAQSNEDEQKRTIDRYIECAQTLVRHGAYETGFALLDNFGMNSSREIVLLDFGELSFQKEVALESVGKQPWAKDRGGVKVLSGEVLDHYLIRMGTELTPEFVNQQWRGSIKAL
jgi:hypothetical protein